MNHGMQFVKTPIVNFSDGNTNLGKESIREIVNLFSELKVGFVLGEKRIFGKEKDAATDTGEGLYWKYKSTLKKWGTELYSVIGAAGELFSIRTELFRKVEKYTLPDDFIIYLRVAQNGYTIQYDPETYAIETASMDVKEELKRKLRISAGGIQSVVRLISILNIFKYGTLLFQHISHRVLRWPLAPLSLLFLIPSGTVLVINERILSFGFYSIPLWLQVVLFVSALLCWYLENRSTEINTLYNTQYPEGVKFE
jgi:cellulose synthase/poly-beta-1,6-N-acetylglucosamine synthase-like glycosyltransferase